MEEIVDKKGLVKDIKRRFGNDAIVRGSILLKDKTPGSAQDE